MGRNKKKSSLKKESRSYKKSFVSSVKDETLQGVLAVLSFVFGAFTVLSKWDKAGVAGKYFYTGLDRVIGVGYYLLPIISVALGISYLRNLHQKFDRVKLVGAFLFLLSALGIIDTVSISQGGFLGSWIAYPFVKLFDVNASRVFFVAFSVISLLLMFNEEFELNRLAFWKMFKRNKKEIDEDEEEEDEDVDVEIAEQEDEEDEEPVKPVKKEEPMAAVSVSIAKSEESDFIQPKKKFISREYSAPPLSLLERDKGKPETGDIKANANIIKRTLANFNIDVEMDEVSIGPSVTRYALKPAEGMKLSKIVALQNDLALALAAHPIRIEAPIPGKSLVGIEIPNTTKTTVGLGTLLSSDEFQGAEKPLMMGLGKGVSGKIQFANMAKMPHMLVAGATGSGKSVTIHALITSLLYRNSPDELKFIMIDPKRVELTLYNKIPHLLTPVITEAKKAILALKWAAKEMDRRYDLLQEKGVRDIESYHKNVLAVARAKGKDVEETVEPMPYIVVIIDELADIMQSYPRELEAGIVRLAQMSRAVGIHLMISTQRPSVNVITGLIKANIPSRVALQVASQIDSRTILDSAGAEKLLGAGDMLFQSGDMSKPVRLQSAFISEGEVKKVVEFLADAYKDELNSSELNLTDGAVASPNSIFSGELDQDDESDDDDKYGEAKQIVIEAGKASTSYLQRKLGVGYARAARLMDILEERGIIGPADGSKPRSVIGGSSQPTPTQTEEPLQ